LSEEWLLRIAKALVKRAKSAMEEQRLRILLFHANKWQRIVAKGLVLFFKVTTTEK